MRLQGSFFLLTYAQTPHALDQQIADKLSAEPKFHGLVLGHELHQDGNEHIHVLVQFKPRIDYKNWDVRTWDVAGHHPNIKVARSPKAAYEYVTKTDLLPLLQGRTLDRIGKNTKQDRLTDLMLSAYDAHPKNKEKFFQHAMESDIGTYTKYFNQIHAFADYHVGEEPRPWAPNPEWTQFPNLPQEAHDWADQYLVCMWGASPTPPSRGTIIGCLGALR